MLWEMSRGSLSKTGGFLWPDGEIIVISFVLELRPNNPKILINFSYITLLYVHQIGRNLNMKFVVRVENEVTRA